jgi:FkbM family methyltransferase
VYLLNKFRNFININPIARRLFVKIVSPFTLPLLILQNYLSISGYKQRKRISLWRKNNPKSILHYKNGIAFNISKNKASVSKSLIFQSNYEFNETNLVKKVIKPGWTVIDAGANFGWYSIHFAQLVGQNGNVFSFEPVPETYEELNLNIKLNSCQNIKTFDLALGSEDGTISFGVSNFDGGGSGASSRFLKYSKRIQTTMRKLDDIIKEQKINKVDFIKADIEGGELSMLKGAEKLLEHFRPKILIEIVDMHCQRFGYSPMDVYQFLINKGYKGVFIGNEYTEEKANTSIDELAKPNVTNLLNGNYFFS